MEQMSDFRIEALPETLHCIPDFVSENEEQLILKKVYEAPKIKWTHLLNRRLQNWGGLPQEKVTCFQKKTRQTAEVPTELAGDFRHFATFFLICNFLK